MAKVTKQMAENLVNGNEKFTKICPRCGGKQSKYPALSRHANIKICSDCGVSEAMEDYVEVATNHRVNSKDNFDDWKLGRK